MNGKTINLTGESIEIKSNNFNVDKNGNTNLNDAKLTFNIRPPRDFTFEDVVIVDDIYNGIITPTPEQIALYDLNKNGVVDEEDWAEINFWYHFANVTTTEPGKLEINGGDATDLITVKDKDGNYKVRIGVDGIYTKSLTVADAQTTLYENWEGDNGDITLSDSAAKYSYIEIYYRNNDNWYNSTKIADPDGKIVELNCSNTNGNYLWTKVRGVEIVGDTITTVSCIETRVGNKVATTTANSNNIYITKVVGYK